MAQHIFSGTTPPNFTPTKLGQHYIDTANKNSYISVGTGSSADWVINNVDIDLNEIASIVPDEDDLIQQKGGIWTNRSLSDLKIDLQLDQVENTSDILKPISNDTQAALDLKIDKNTPITPGTNTKITYDEEGLVTSATSATTDDIDDTPNRRYVTDAILDSISDDINIVTGVTVETQIDFSSLLSVNTVEWTIVANSESDDYKRYSSKIAAIAADSPSGVNVNHSEYSINTVGGDITGLVFNVDVNSNNIRLLATSTESVTIKTIRRVL